MKLEVADRAEAVAVGGSGTPHIPCTVLDDEEGATPGCCSKVEGGIDDDVGEGPCTILEDDPGDEERSEGADTTIPANAIEYLNRLGDLLFVLGRVANRQAGVADDPWIHP